jgi:hypothetical protein
MPTPEPDTYLNHPTLSPLSVDNKVVSSKLDRDRTPIKINPDNMYICNKRCELDVDDLKGDSDTRCNMTTNNTNLPYISLDFHELGDETSKPLSITFQDQPYKLMHILIVDGYIHTLSSNQDSTHSKEIMLLFENDTLSADSSIDKHLCISVFAEISDNLTTGSEFFSQIFDILKKNKDIASKYIKLQSHSNKTGDQYLEIKVGNNWNPTMIIPSNKTFYWYKGTFPFTTGPQSPFHSSPNKCTWIIFKESITILKDTWSSISKILKSNDVAINNNLNTIKNSAKPPLKHVYKHIDSKYRDKLKPEDLVVKCEKNGQCDPGDIQTNDKEDLNHRLTSCPTTMSSKELDNIYSDIFDNIFPKTNAAIVKTINILLYCASVIFGYIIARYCMYSYNSNWFIHLPFWIAHGIVSVGRGGKNIGKHAKGAAKGAASAAVAATGTRQAARVGRRVHGLDEKLGDAVGVQGVVSSAAEAAAAVAERLEGGNLINQHTRFLNHYNQIRH